MYLSWIFMTSTLFQPLRNMGRARALPAVREETPSFHCLDYCCRTGYTTYLLQQKFPEANVVGYDPDVLNLEIAQSTYPFKLHFTRTWDMFNYKLIQLYNEPPKHSYQMLSDHLDVNGMLWIHEKVILRSNIAQLDQYFEYYDSEKKLHFFIPKHNS